VFSCQNLVTAIPSIGAQNASQQGKEHVDQNPAACAFVARIHQFGLCADLQMIKDDQGAIDWNYVRIDITDERCARPGMNAPWSAWMAYWRCKYPGWFYSGR
jgi:hypothetical protein